MVRAMILVLALTASAAADGAYVTESVGGSTTQGELATRIDGALRIRLGAGYRQRQWAIEGWLATDLALAREPSGGCDCIARTTTPPGQTPSAAVAFFSYGLDLKYVQPLSPNLEVYVRGSASRGMLSTHAGNGLGIGAGVQLKGQVRALGFLFWPLFFTKLGPKITAAVILDHGVDGYRLHERGGGGGAIDGRLTHLTLGFAAGTDF